jgi:hypothetical protein
MHAWHGHDRNGRDAATEMKAMGLHPPYRHTDWEPDGSVPESAAPFMHAFPLSIAW